MMSALLMAAEFGTRVIRMVTLMCLCCSFDGRRPTATISRPHCRWNSLVHQFHLREIWPEVLAYLRDSTFGGVGYEIISVR